jgi:uncharacterized protein (DUF302 family)
MEYYHSKTVRRDFEESIRTVTELLKAEGFGIVSTIDMQAKLKEKLGVDYKKYTILGACNPPYAYKTLLEEEKIGVMLPCNVLVIDKENGTTEVVAVNPVASMMAIQNPALKPLAEEVNTKLSNVINRL